LDTFAKALNTETLNDYGELLLQKASECVGLCVWLLLIVETESMVVGKPKGRGQYTLDMAPLYESSSSQKRSYGTRCRGSHSFTCRPRVYSRME